MNRRFALPPVVVRLLACLGGSIVLAMMVGSQQGSKQDYGLAFRESVLNVRIVYFLLIGVLVFLALTYQGVVQRHIRRPGVRPLVIGVFVLLAAYFLMRWYDPLGDGKFGTFGDAVVSCWGSSRRRCRRPPGTRQDG